MVGSRNAPVCHDGHKFKSEPTKTLFMQLTLKPVLLELHQASAGYIALCARNTIRTLDCVAFLHSGILTAGTSLL